MDPILKKYKKNVFLLGRPTLLQMICVRIIYLGLVANIIRFANQLHVYIHEGNYMHIVNLKSSNAPKRKLDAC